MDDFEDEVEEGGTVSAPPNNSRQFNMNVDEDVKEDGDEEWQDVESPRLGKGDSSGPLRRSSRAKRKTQFKDSVVFMGNKGWNAHYPKLASPVITIPTGDDNQDASSPEENNLTPLTKRRKKMNISLITNQTGDARFTHHTHIHTC